LGKIRILSRCSADQGSIYSYGQKQSFHLLEKYGDEKYDNCQKNSNKIGER